LRWAMVVSVSSEISVIIFISYFPKDLISLSIAVKSKG
jgi:hypothetical protein